jgi:hypothetical protein
VTKKKSFKTSTTGVNNVLVVSSDELMAMLTQYIQYMGQHNQVPQ